MGIVYVSPTEPHAIKALGRVSIVPEEYGCDVLWVTETGDMCGVQRKEFKDLVGSMNDGRLGKEVHQMEGLTYRMVVVEGKPKWTREGELMDGWTSVTLRQVKAFLWSVRNQGVWVDYTEDISGTVNCVKWFMDWTSKDKHTALLGRPGPRGDGWGRVTNKHWQKHFLMSLPGVGSELADKILEYYGGIPFSLDTDVVELMQVYGIGKVKAQQIVDVFGREDEHGMEG